MFSTRLLMTSSAMAMAAAGIAATFAPDEILATIAPASAHRTFTPIVQVAGALYLGFAMLNWMTRGSALGGIYGRPLVVSNLTHFVVAALALVKLAERDAHPVSLTAAVIYAAFAAMFGLTLFRSPA
jgi:hypothetical protein